MLSESISLKAKYYEICNQSCEMFKCIKLIEADILISSYQSLSVGIFNRYKFLIMHKFQRYAVKLTSIDNIVLYTKKFQTVHHVKYFYHSFKRK